jgi:hypothetical protein
MTLEELRIRESIDRFVSRTRQDLEKHLETLAGELLQAAEGGARGDDSPDSRQAAVEVARAISKGGGQARHDLITRLAEAIRGLDDSRTLRATLEVLAYGAAAEASRVAVMIVDDQMLRCWGQHGFPAGRGPVDLPADVSGVLSASLKLQQISMLPPAGPRPDPTLPAFMRVPDGHVGMLTPLVVGGQVVALVYADGPDQSAEHGTGSVWTEQVEVLVRHAASRLENLTSRRAVEVLTGHD